MNRWKPEEFGPILSALIDVEHRSPLGPGRPRQESRSALDLLSVENAFAHTQVADEEMARCCLSGLWLHHDYLDRSHDFSQEIRSASGSFWHGIMHRREQDYGNAKYWFRQVGDHPVYGCLVDQIASSDLPEMSDTSMAGKIGIGNSSWDPYAFVDACQQAAGRGGTEESFCQGVAWIEWQVLFQFCYDQAVV